MLNKNASRLEEFLQSLNKAEATINNLSVEEQLPGQTWVVTSMLKKTR